MINITSSELLDDIDQSFKISAGPGAGKTYWLTQHIKNVLQNSKLLSNNRKIACITYTNIGVDILKNRLGHHINAVDVSTIHSFLYFNILKPYIHFIAEEYELSFLKIKRHEDINISKSKVIEWINNHKFKDELKSKYSVAVLTKDPEKLQELASWLRSFQFDHKVGVFSTNSVPRKTVATGRKILEKDYWSFKKLYWQNGRISHEDVLFFSYTLIERYPFILDTLIARYPFLFIDEYQDTSPMQAYLVDVLAKKGMFIGLIGDYCQSIYGFQGAEVSLFRDAIFPQQFSYLMKENHRSTVNIVDLLNFLRSDDDLKQEVSEKNCIATSNKERPKLLVGNRDLLMNFMKKLFGDEFTILARKNNVVDSFMNDKNYKVLLLNIDSNTNRKWIILTFIEIIEFILKSNFDDALFRLEKFYRKHAKINIVDENKLVADMVKMLSTLCTGYSKDFSLTEFKEFITVQCIQKSLFLSDIKIANFRKGPTLDFYDSTTYQQVSLSLQEERIDSSYRTIHKSKGDEFDNVCLVLEEEKDLDFLLSPNILDDEEHRVYYVGASRAKNNLYIYIPKLSLDNKQVIEKLDLIDIIELS